MGEVYVQKTCTEHTNLFPSSNPSNIELVFFEKRKIIESFQGDQNIGNNDDDGSNVNILHALILEVWVFKWHKFT